MTSLLCTLLVVVVNGSAPEPAIRAHYDTRVKPAKFYIVDADRNASYYVQSARYNSKTNTLYIESELIHKDRFE